MAQDVIITPADGEIEWQDNTTGVALIDIDANNNLSITNIGGNLSIGDGSSDVYVGNGVASVDLVFEQDGEIRGTGSQTLTLGTSGDTIAINTGVDFLVNNSRMVITTDGNVGIGIVAPQRPFTLYKASTPVIQLVNSTTGTAAADGMLLTQSGVDSYIENGEAGKMFFRTSATTRVTIDSSGKVGIGVSPANNLTVAGDIGYTGYLGQGSIYGNAANASYARVQLYDPATGYTTFNNISYGYYFQTANSTKVTILNNGNVGIGTTIPTYGLEIRNSTTSQTGALYVQAALNSSGKGLVINSNTRTTSDNAEHLLQIIDRSNSDSLVTTVEGVTLAKLSTRLNTLSPLQVNSQIALGGSLYTFSTVQGGADLTLTSNANPANLGVLSNIKFELGSSGGGGPNERMRIQSDGSIGVWNTTDIENWAGSLYRAIEFPRASLMYNTGTSTDVYINSNAYYDGAWKYKSTAAASQFILGSSGDALIRTIASGTIDTGITWTTPFIVKNTGNVGIGTTSPSAKLQIVGSTSGDSLLKVDGTNGTLFEVVDDLSDSLMSVNDAAGLPVFEVFADNTIVGGRYNKNDFYLQGSSGKIGIGTDAPDATALTIQDLEGSVISGTKGVFALKNYAGVVTHRFSSQYITNFASQAFATYWLYNPVNSLPAFYVRADNTLGPRLQLNNSSGSSSVYLSTYAGIPTAFNVGLENIDFNVRGDSDINLFYADASTDRIGIGTASPAVKLEVNGDATVAGDLSAGGSAAANRTLTINSVAQAGRPAAKINNPNLDTATASDGRTFHGWLPIDLDGTVKYIPVYN